MAWTSLITGTTITSASINDNFTHIRVGDVLPLSGTSMAACDKSADLGQDIYYWNDIHVHNFEFKTGELPSNSGMTLIAQTTLTGTVTSIEVSGLTANINETYYIIFRGAYTTNTAINYTLLHPNAISTTTRYFTQVCGTGTTNYNENSNMSGYIVGKTLNTTTINYSFCEMYLEPVASRTTQHVLYNISSYHSATVYHIAFGSSYNFTNTFGFITTTSLKFINATKNFVSNTMLQIWKV